MTSNLDSIICDAVDAMADELLAVSHAIHQKPELAFKEYFACETLTNALSEHEMNPEVGIFTLPTAFEATLNADSDGPVVAILAEYDALPKIGHSCGHNFQCLLEC